MRFGMEHSKSVITGCHRDWGLGVTCWCAPEEQSLEMDRVGRRQLGQQQSGGSAILNSFFVLFCFFPLLRERGMEGLEF